MNPLVKWQNEFKEKRYRIILLSELNTPDKIVEYFSYENMRANHPKFCPLYESGKVCHAGVNILGFNCFFCACPFFDASIWDEQTFEFGACMHKSGRGSRNKAGFWDCRDCYFVHSTIWVLKYVRENRGENLFETHRERNYICVNTKR